MLSFPESVEIIEVGPRDGLQQVSRLIPVEEKLRMVQLLIDAGYRTIEVTSFVRPDRIPQLADAPELMARLPRGGATRFRVLAPNLKGTERAIESGADEVLGLITATDTYNELNAGMSVARNLDVLDAVAARCSAARVPVVVAIGNALFCPYEGPTPSARLLEIVDRLVAAGVTRVYLATSVGMDGPRDVFERCSQVLGRHSQLSLGLHLHNTNGMALANALAGMEAGVRWFEGSVCGLGGGIVMPHNGQANIGNIASEDLVAMFAGAGVETGLDLDRVREAAAEVADLLGIESHSSLLSAGTREDVLAQGRAALH